MRKGVPSMENELTYTQIGDYQIPDLIPGEPMERPLGQYGRMRRDYLKEYRPGLFSWLLLSGKLYAHLLEIEDTANERLKQILSESAKAAGATEELKAQNMMKWVGLMNNCKAQAEEIIRTELLYS